MPDLLLVLSLLSISCGGGPTTESILPEGPDTPKINLASTAFTEGGMIPKVYSCDGKDVSPPLAWSGVPEKAKSLAVLVEDPDAPGGTFAHWILFNVSPDVKSLDEGVASGDDAQLGAPGKPASQGKNGFGKFGYGGPCPPVGPHHYVFRVYALDTTLDRAQGASREDLLRAMKGHVLGEGRLSGKYTRAR
jgi:Raf kinase inhibitor-like YbhB/YbcL family protein